MAKVEKGKESKVTNVNRDQEQYKRRRNEALKHVDIVKMFMNEPYQLTDKITIYQPTIGEIIKFGDHGQYGEKEFYSSINVFVSNTTSYRLQLWDMGIDWNKITDFELFTMLLGTLNDDVQRMLFGDVNLKKLKPYAVTKPQQEQTEGEGNPDGNGGTQGDDGSEKKPEKPKDVKPEFTLYDPETQVEINEETYIKMASYIRVMFNIFPKVERAKGKSTKEDLIREERDKLSMNKDKDSHSMLFPMISACLNSPGFKYKRDELKQLGIVEFMDSVQRLQVINNADALTHAALGGFADLSKVDKEEMNFMRDMYT